MCMMIDRLRGIWCWIMQREHGRAESDTSLFVYACQDQTVHRYPDITTRPHPFVLLERLQVQTHVCRRSSTHIWKAVYLLNKVIGRSVIA